MNDHPGQITEELNLKIICQQVLLSVIHNQRVKVANRRQLFDNLTKSDCKLTNFDCKLTNSNCKLTNSDCNLTNSDCKFIPHICHERHEHARVNFFGRCKFFFRFNAKIWQFAVYFAAIYAFFRCKSYSPKILPV